MKKYLIAAIVLLLGILSVSVKSCLRNQSEKNRLADNQRTLMSDVDFYRTRDSLSAAGVERLTLTNREFGRYCVELEKTVEALGLKVKRLQSVGRTATETRYIVETVVRDSIVPGRADTLRCVDYRDAYLTLSGCVSQGQFSGVVESRDTIVQVVHRVPRRFWFLRWGCKAVRQEVVSRNPHNQICYTEYVELKNR